MLSATECSLLELLSQGCLEPMVLTQKYKLELSFATTSRNNHPVHYFVFASLAPVVQVLLAGRDI
eukprot:961693-Amphidinium_carterae.1